MKRNPADEINTTMWSFLMTHGQKANIPRLKEVVYDLIGMTTQKTAGQRHVKKDLSWKELGMTLMDIAIEATALVLSGMLDGEEQWIPVTEGLPEDNEMVLVSCRTKKGVTSVNLGYYDEDEFWHGSGSMSEVVAWMELPKPYKGGKK